MRDWRNGVCVLARVAAFASAAACNGILGNNDKVLAIDAAGAIESGVGDEGDSAGSGSSSDGGAAALEAGQIPDAEYEVETTPPPDVVVAADAADVVVAALDGCSLQPPTTVGCSAVDLYNYPQQYCTVTPNSVYTILPTPPECLCNYACSCILAHMPCPTGQMTTSQSLGVTCETGSTGGVALGCADATDGGADAGDVETGPDAGTLSMGLVAYYPFDEAAGATSVDASGNGHTATMQGATFAPGVIGNAASLNGTTGFVSLPAGIVSTLTSFSICTWVNLTTSPPHNEIFDFGTGMNAYMNLSASSTAAPPTLQFAITSAGFMTAQKIDAPVLANGAWQHVCVTLAGTTGTIFVNGAQTGATVISLNPSSLGATTQNWIGRSQFPADPLMNGLIDNFRIYSRALAPTEIQALFQQQL